MKQHRQCMMGIAVLACAQICAFGQANPCPRPTPGSTVVNPPALYSSGGSLTVNLSYNTATDADGRTLYCFTTSDGKESPTLHVRPGDRLIINLKNNLPNPSGVVPMRMPETTI